MITNCFVWITTFFLNCILISLVREKNYSFVTHSQDEKNIKACGLFLPPDLVSPIWLFGSPSGEIPVGIFATPGFAFLMVISSDFITAKTVVLIREAIKLAFLWASWVSGASAFVGSIILSNFLLKLDSLFLFWEMKAIPCEKLPRNWRFPTTVCTTPFREQHKQALTRIEREVGGPGAQLSKRTSKLESLVWEIDASQVFNWQLH